MTLPSTPIPVGHARIVLDGTDGPLEVTARADTTFVPAGYDVPATRSGLLCTTPCVVDLPVGRYKLFMFGRSDGDGYAGDTDLITVANSGLVYYSRAPGRREPPTWTPVVPTAILVAAIVLVTAGASTVGDRDTGEANPVGLGLIGAGIAVGIGGGILHYDQARGAIQEGATTTWSP